MTFSLGVVAEWAGHSLSEADLEKVRVFLAEYLEEIRQLRELVLPDDIEPVTQLRMERWD